MSNKIGMDSRDTRIVFATNNAHKLDEIKAILPAQIALLSLADIGFVADIPEPWPTLEENAMHKARIVYNFCKLPVFADDTGLEVDALGGQPGVLSARYAGTAKDPQANMQKLLAELLGKTNRQAQFRTVIAYICDLHEHCFEGIVRGTIREAGVGQKGFGYDPVFIPAGHKQSFAEMEQELKNKISHRGRAMEKFIAFLQESTQ